MENTKTLIPNKNAKSSENLFENISEKVEEFNQYFANVSRETYQRTRGPYENNRININMSENKRVRNFTNKIRLQPVTVETVILIVKDLRETKTVGIDKTGL